MNDFSPQLIHSMPRADYDKRGEVNFSTLKLMGKSPAHYHAALLNAEAPDSDARQRGRATHVAVLEPDLFRTEYVVYPERRAGKAWEAFQLANADKEILTSKMYVEATELARHARMNPAAIPYLSGGRSEATLLWRFDRPAMGGLDGYSTLCRSRLDFIANCGALVDLKTTRDASPSGFGREVARYAYHSQAAFYSDAYAAVTGKALPYIWVAVEATAPYVTMVYRASREALELGREQYIDWLDRLNFCRSQNHWPGYGEGVCDVELPAWLDPDDDENDDLTGLITTEAA